MQMTQKVNVTFNVTKYFFWPQSIMDYTQTTLTTLWFIPKKIKRDIRNWMYNDVMSARPEVT